MVCQYRTLRNSVFNYRKTPDWVVRFILSLDHHHIDFLVVDVFIVSLLFWIYLLHLKQIRSLKDEATPFREK